MILALDVGNTRLKWALHDHGRFVHEGAAVLTAADIPDWSSIDAPARVIGANVAGALAQAKVEALAARWKLPVKWVVPAASACGVINGYEVPAQLGPDRWAAMIGARARISDACVVASAGTALTVDALASSGEFLGGLILPGLDLMQQSLSENTARLGQLRGAWRIFPRNSGDAITSGALQGAAGSVQRMVEAMRGAGHESPRVLVTGGNARALIALLPGSEHVERLVLDGLVRLALAGLA